MPDITSDFVFNPRENIKLIQGRHPVVYVGSGSHAAYPTGGDFLVYEKASTNERWENMTHTGLVLSTQADNFHCHLWERYDLVLLSEPDVTDTTNNMDLSASMSVDSPDSYPVSTPIIGSLANSLVGQQGNDSPPGPYHKGWESSNSSVHLRLAETFLDSKVFAVPFGIVTYPTKSITTGPSLAMRLGVIDIIRTGTPPGHAAHFRRHFGCLAGTLFPQPATSSFFRMTPSP